MGYQETKFIDVTRTYLPQDPNAFPDSLHVEDQKEEQRVPVMAIDARNILPTSYGYRSYFGHADHLAGDPLEARVDHLLIFQSTTRQNVLIALCDSGIWAKVGTAGGAWQHLVTLEDFADTPTIHFDWTYAVIGEELFCYRANGEHFYQIGSIVSSPYIQVTERTCAFLTMTAQMGIFRAGNRLGFWDSDDSISWSSIDDPADHNPSVETLAGNSKYKEVTGRISMIISHGDGFIIYATRSIVHIRRVADSIYLWNPETILQKAGVAFKEEVAAGAPDTVHYACTSSGIYEITDGVPKLIIPEFHDFLKEKTQPRYVKFLEGRFLFFEIMTRDYQQGCITYQLIEGEDLTIELRNDAWAELITAIGSQTISIVDLIEALRKGCFVVATSGGGPEV